MNVLRDNTYNGCVAGYRQGLPGMDNQLTNLGNSSLSVGFAKLAPSESPITLQALSVFTSSRKLPGGLLIGDNVSRATRNGEAVVAKK